MCSRPVPLPGSSIGVTSISMPKMPQESLEVIHSLQSLWNSSIAMIMLKSSGPCTGGMLHTDPGAHKPRGGAGHPATALPTVPLRDGVDSEARLLGWLYVAMPQLRLQTVDDRKRVASGEPGRSTCQTRGRTQSLVASSERKPAMSPTDEARFIVLWQRLRVSVLFSVVMLVSLAPNANAQSVTIGPLKNTNPQDVSSVSAECEISADERRMTWHFVQIRVDLARTPEAAAAEVEKLLQEVTPREMTQTCKV
jgi:hypothetical protein